MYAECLKEVVDVMYSWLEEVMAQLSASWVDGFEKQQGKKFHLV